MKSKNSPVTHSNLESNEFRKIESLDFLYEINQNGTIFRNVKSKKQLKITFVFNHSGKGYYSVWATVKGIKCRRAIQSLVAECWLGKRPKGYKVEHIDHDSHNNDYRNLRYVAKDNNAKGIEKPVKIMNSTETITFGSIAFCAKWLAEKYQKKVEDIRNKLKKRRSHIYDYDIVYL